ncbi:MAG: hypothetical protein QOJ32_3034 [Frankiaceae bacterium]|jgi:hypothetical protein|nr:hypothetical protein [Frankiaceae bacterium]MDQ1636225.1 hypothetical protein [Frankiaceae bacterium]MDQ1647968.1 hypothetical protein [Frankiaceae bacterium]MDQ1674047.1 hypothetical protein [Frankiaceae bacterium]
MRDTDNQKLADLALLGLLAVAVLTVAVPFLSPVRAFVVFFAVLLVPGAAVLTFLEIERPSTYVALAAVLSLAVCTAGSLALTWLHFWHPLVLAGLLAVGSAALLSTDLSRRLQPRTAHPSTEDRA